MVFTSFNFLVFFPLLAVVYYITPVRYRWLTLLIGSYFFYINIKPVYALLTAGITVSTYYFTRLIEKTRKDLRKKRLMVVNIILILLPLLFYKYFSPINNALLSFLENHGLRWPLPEIDLILPVGISFYTFMAVGYTIDVYNEEIESETHFGRLALFISFFPLVLSGPIERARNMLPQFRAQKKLDYSVIVQGFRLMLWGYFMKLVVADRIGIYVDEIYGKVFMHNGTSFLIASLLRPFQVYADLGGYSLIAIGTAKALGFNVMCNFNRPFFATSMAEFWRRWHISLISWLTDYIYTPLAFHLRNLKVLGIVLALLLTFLISGLWHGASLTFVVWGLLQGMLLSLEAIIYPKRSALEERYQLNRKPLFIGLSVVITYLLFSASLIFERAGSLSNAFIIFDKIFSELTTPHLDITTLLYSLIGILIIMFRDFKDEYFPGKLQFFNNKTMLIRYCSYFTVIFMIILFGVFGGNRFIYFQF